MEEKGTTLEEILTKVAGQRTKEAYFGGDPDVSMLPSGQVVGLIDEIKTVKEVIDDVIAEAVELRERLKSMGA